MQIERVTCCETCIQYNIKIMRKGLNQQQLDQRMLRAVG